MNGRFRGLIEELSFAVLFGIDSKVRHVRFSLPQGIERDRLFQAMPVKDL